MSREKLIPNRCRRGCYSHEAGGMVRCPKWAPKNTARDRFDCAIAIHGLYLKVYHGHKKTPSDRRKIARIEYEAYKPRQRQRR